MEILSKKKKKKKKTNNEIEANRIQYDLKNRVDPQQIII